KYQELNDNLGVRVGQCRTVAHAGGRQNLTTNLGVRSSNLFGRAKQSGISRADMSLGKRARDSQETLHARRPFKCDADVVIICKEIAVAQLCSPSCSLFLAELFSTHAPLSHPPDRR